jgi:hypothetical protein
VIVVAARVAFPQSEKIQKNMKRQAIPFDWPSDFRYAFG